MKLAGFDTWSCFFDTSRSKSKRNQACVRLCSFSKWWPDAILNHSQDAHPGKNKHTCFSPVLEDIKLQPIRRKYRTPWYTVMIHQVSPGSISGNMSIMSIITQKHLLNVHLWKDLGSPKSTTASRLIVDGFHFIPKPRKVRGLPNDRLKNLPMLPFQQFC